MQLKQSSLESYTIETPFLSPSAEVQQITLRNEAGRLVMQLVGSSLEPSTLLSKSARIKLDMPYQEVTSFYLYGRAHDIRLGHLVLGNYKTPTHVPHCRIPPLNDDELSSWTTTAPFSGTFTNTQGWNINAEVEVMELGRLGGGLSSEKRKIIRLTRLAHVNRDKVRDFFQEKVLPAKGVKEHLKRWLTVSRTKYVLHRARLKPVPEIWCLTGLIELHDVTAVTIVKRSPSVTFGISSALVAALSAAPVGGSVEVGKDFVATCDSKNPEQGVWAAQFQLIDARPALRMDDDEAHPVNFIELYPDYTYAGGGVLGDEDADNALELEVEDIDDRDTAVDEFDEEYWEAYRHADKITKDVYMLPDIED
ncbi:LOW QUALITY PROTEIN: hypothetical protein HJFPF1_08046 [Paramyrothecium foliicola]|nr:LOW QUALITY PROTEIN: hypothetical protein HJFPF1_08046 [Paramyrothecium foliicola]